MLQASPIWVSRKWLTSRECNRFCPLVSIVSNGMVRTRSTFFQLIKIYTLMLKQKIVIFFLYIFLVIKPNIITYIQDKINQGKMLKAKKLIFAYTDPDLKDRTLLMFSEELRPDFREYSTIDIKSLLQNI